MKTLLLLTCLSIAALEPVNVGTITATSKLVWDANAEPNLSGYNIYVEGAKVATVSTNEWCGDETAKLYGQKMVHVTALNEAGMESEPSETLLITFKAGIPLPPKGFQIYQVVTSAATNAARIAPSMPPMPDQPKETP